MAEEVKGSLFRIELFEDFFGGVERGVSSRYAAVDGGLEENFLNFVTGDADGKCGFEMETKLFIAIEGDEHGEGEKAAGLARQAGAAPNFAPGVTGNQVLKRFIEFGAILERAIDVRIAKNFAARFQALVVAFAFVHEMPPGVREFDYARNERTSLVTRSGASTLERWEALTSTY